MEITEVVMDIGEEEADSIGEEEVVTHTNKDKRRI